GAIIEDAPVGRPRERPAVAEVVLGVGGLARIGLVDDLAIRPLDGDARVDPAPRCRLAVVGQVAERRDRLALLVDDLPVLVGDVLGGDAVDPLYAFQHVRLFGIAAELAVRGAGALVARLARSGVALRPALPEL